MRNRPINIQVMSNAINEYLLSNQSYIEICDKYDIKSYTFFYHLKKHRMNITLSLTGGGIVNNASKNPSNVNISACLPAGQTGQASNGDKIVSINTSSKKMQEYLKHHPI